MNYRQLMVHDGAPPALFLTPAVRAEAWVGRPLTTIPLFQAAPKDESAETKAFRVQEEERRRLKSLEGIARMKLRMATKAIDFSKVRWDARRNKFVPLEGNVMPKSEPPGLLSIKRGLATVNRAVEEMALQQRCTQQTRDKIDADRHAKAKPVDPIWFRVNKDTARRLAELNGVWDDKYAKLSGGLLVMTVTNRMKGLVKKGIEIKWG